MNWDVKGQKYEKDSVHPYIASRPLNIGSSINNLSGVLSTEDRMFHISELFPAAHVHTPLVAVCRTGDYGIDH
jgi:hypothetical protein